MLQNYIQKKSAFVHLQQNIFARHGTAPPFSIQGMGIADKIKELRERKKLTQTQLADLCGVKYQSVQYWERGVGAPRHKRLEKLASVLGVSVSELVQGDNEQFPGIREEARHLLTELLHLATENKLSDNDIGLIRSIVGRLSGKPDHPQRRKTDVSSDWIIGGPAGYSSNKKKTQ